MGLLSSSKSTTQNYSETTSLLGGAAGYGGASVTGTGNTTSINVVDAGAIQAMERTSANNAILAAGTVLSQADLAKAAINANGVVSLESISAMERQTREAQLALANNAALSISAANSAVGAAVSGVTAAAGAAINASQNSAGMAMQSMYGALDSTLHAISSGNNVVIDTIREMWSDYSGRADAQAAQNMQVQADLTQSALKTTVDAADANAAAMQDAIKKIATLAAVLGIFWMMKK